MGRAEMEKGWKIEKAGFEDVECNCIETGFLGETVGDGWFPK